MNIRTFTASRRRSTLVACLLIFFSIALVGAPMQARAQSSAQVDEAERRRAFQLFGDGVFLEALPILEKLAVAHPSDTAVLFRLGFSIIARTATMRDAAKSQQERARARAVLARAKQLGMNDPLLEKMLEAIEPDGSEKSPNLSSNEKANEAMREAEDAFVKGEAERAAAAYGRALSLDPKLYEAPLFAGDAYFKNKQYDKAGEWYARAIQINPDRETGYRYWGNALLLAGKTREARDKYIEAIIADPYNGYVWENGLFRWAGQTGVKLSHPEIKQPPPSMQTEEKDGQTFINIDPKTFGEKNYWTYYDLIRLGWRKETFVKEYPQEKTYRHSLKEEASALGAVADIAAKDLKERKTKSLDRSLLALIKLKEEGLLEAYILFARANEGIARDYADYRKANRDKLRRYLTQYVAPAGD